nr:NifU family protein [uncultured Rhodopila sp.]
MTDEERLNIITATVEAARPAVQADGGDLELVGIDGHRVRVRLSGACTTCSMAGQTLGGIRRKLMQVLDGPVMVVPA